jgi:hypothetical protein
MEDKVMAEGAKQRVMRRRATPDGPRLGSPRRRAGWVLPGVALLLIAIIGASVAACSSSTEAASDTTTTSAAAGATGQTRPAGGPPSGNGPQMMQGGTATTGATTSTTLAQTTTSSAGPTTTTTLAEGSYSDGIYLAGTDISSGLYKGTANGDGAHWEISSDANGEVFVASGDPVGQFYVKVTSGYYLRLSGVVIAKASTTAADPLLSSNISDGTYRVGYDIEAGWYQGTVNDHMGYWEVSSDANGQTLVANDYATAPFTLNVTSGQYITLRGVTIGQ